MPSRSVRSWRSMSDRVLLNGTPLARGNVGLDPRQRLVQPGAADHQIADAAHQLVQAGQIDADKVRRRHASAPRVDPGRLDGRRGSDIVGLDGRLFLRQTLGGHAVFPPAGKRLFTRPRGDDELERDGALADDVRRGLHDFADRREPFTDRVNADAASHQLL